MVEEWCGDSGGRLIPLTSIPLWDAQLAAAEVRRNAARGVHAVCFSEIPPKLGLPSIHSGEWDPFFAACQETNTVVCMHIGSSSQMPATSGDAPVAVAATLSFNNAMASLSDFLFSGVLVRFPDLKLAYSEGQIGWLPYVLERADDVWREHRAWGGVKDIVPEPPSTYYYQPGVRLLLQDRHGLESLDRVGVDNITFETDYPHTDSTWPDTKEVARGRWSRACPTTRSTRSCAATRSACCRSTSTERHRTRRRRHSQRVPGRRDREREQVVVDVVVDARRRRGRTRCDSRPRTVSRRPESQLARERLRPRVRRGGIVGGADHDDRRRARRVDRRRPCPRRAPASTCTAGRATRSTRRSAARRARRCAASCCDGRDASAATGASRQPIA